MWWCITGYAHVAVVCTRNKQGGRESHQQRHCFYRSDEEAEVDILSGAGALLGKNKQLAPGLIETTRLRDANQQEPSKSVVQSVEFHPAGQLLLTAGLDKRLRLFQVVTLFIDHHPDLLNEVAMGVVMYNVET